MLALGAWSVNIISFSMHMHMPLYWLSRTHRILISISMHMPSLFCSLRYIIVACEKCSTTPSHHWLLILYIHTWTLLLPKEKKSHNSYTIIQPVQPNIDHTVAASTASTYFISCPSSVKATIDPGNSSLHKDIWPHWDPLYYSAPMKGCNQM